MNNVSCRVPAWCAGRLTNISTCSRSSRMLNNACASHMRCISSTSSLDPSAKDALMCSESPPSPRNDSGDVFARPAHARKYGGRDLPMPVFMYPSKIIERAQQRQRKGTPELACDDLRELEQQLEANPYAHAMATPIRMCSLTMAPLPSHFLFKFGVTWTESPRGADGGATAPTGQIVYDGHDSRVTGSGSYIIVSNDAMRHVGLRQNWRVLVRDRMRDDVAHKSQRSMRIGKKVATVLSWEKNMPDIVLESLRDAVRLELKRCAGHMSSEGQADDAQSLITPCARRPITDTAEEVVCILLVDGQAEEPSCSEGVLIYDLYHLLDEESFADAMSGFVGRDADALTVAKHKETVALALALDRLQEYIGDSSEM